MSGNLSPAIYDSGSGIIIELFLSDGVTINFHMDDEAAQEMIYIIQNKLNARVVVDDDLRRFKGVANNDEVER